MTLLSEYSVIVSRLCFCCVYAVLVVGPVGCRSKMPYRELKAHQVSAVKDEDAHILDVSLNSKTYELRVVASAEIRAFVLPRYAAGNDAVFVFYRKDGKRFDEPQSFLFNATENTAPEGISFFKEEYESIEDLLGQPLPRTDNP